MEGQRVDFILGGHCKEKWMFTAIPFSAMESLGFI